MATLQVFNPEGKKISDIEAPKSISEGPVRKTLLWETVKMQMANRRAGTHSTKTRGEMSGSTKKIYRQKGTGNARHGDIKAPIFVGSGQAHGPHPRDYSYRIPRSARLQALKSALKMKLKEGKLKILSDFSLNEIKTKKMAELFKKLEAPEALMIIADKNLTIEKSVRNLSHHKVLRAEGINVYDLLNYDQVILTQEALKKIEERLQ
ncbi:MAG: 50S ribosomal protein L4 [Deltaproteobacteria bacterium]|nr:50S ribosomal protein L4 [Deltaproteobacteria bacterium]